MIYSSSTMRGLNKHFHNGVELKTQFEQRMPRAVFSTWAHKLEKAQYELELNILEVKLEAQGFVIIRPSHKYLLYSKNKAVVAAKIVKFLPQNMNELATNFTLDELKWGLALLRKGKKVAFLH